MKRLILITLTILALTVLHIGFQPSTVRAENSLNTQLNKMLISCNEPAECQAILNVLKKRGAK